MNVKPLLSLSLVSILLSACSSHHLTPGQDMIYHAEHTHHLGEQWNKANKESKEGKKQIHEGEAMIKKGRAMMQKGKQKVAHGKKMVDKGNEKMHTTELSYAGILEENT